MKICNIIVFFIITFVGALAQTPQKMSYQAVIRDANGQLMKNRNIGMQISVLQGSENGAVVFAERFFPSTNENGLVTVEIGGGLSVNGSLSAIDWKSGPFFIKTETDINGGANYTLSATSQLLSIPYALLAKNVENVPSLKMDDLTDVDATNIQAGQLLKWDGTNWKPANDATTGGPGTTYTPGAGISIDVNNVISNTGDLSNTNEIQQLELAGNQLKLTGANTVTLPTGTTYTAGPGISLNNNTITNTGDNDNNPDNELQQISLSGTILTLSDGGGSVVLPTGGSGSGDNWGTQSVETDNTISGDGTPSQPLKIANQSATNGQVLKFNGNTWIPNDDNDGQNLSINNNQLTISNGNTITLPADGDGSPTNEIQMLSLSGANLNLSNGGGSIALPDASITNEIQTISLSGANVNLSSGGGSITLPDASAMNEIQTLSISGQNLSLSNGGGTVTIPSGSGPWTISGNDIMNNNSGGVNIGSNGYAQTKFSVTGGEQFSIYADASSYNAVIRANQDHASADAIQGIVVSGNGDGVMGESSSGNGVKGISSNGNGVFGVCFSEPSSGVYGKSESSGIGVQGTSQTGIGIYGRSFGGDIGIQGICWGGTGIQGNSSGNGIGIQGVNLDFQGYAGFFIGRVFGSQIKANNYEGSIIPLTTSTEDLGSTSLKWDKLYINTIIGAKHEGAFLPTTNGDVNLGGPLNRWDTGYFDEVRIGAGPARFASTGLDITCSSDFFPDATNSNDLGSTSLRWKKLYTNTAVDVSSDKRLKENIFPITYGLKEVLNMEPVSYNLKDDKKKSVQLGYLAQDLKKLIPTVVHGDENNEMLSVTYTELIPVLTKAIQEQQVMIDHLNTENEALKRMMKEEMTSIKALIDKSDSLAKIE